MNSIKKNADMLILIGVFSLFVIYGTAVPFNFTNIDAASRKVHTINWQPLYNVFKDRTSIFDIVQNILLFIPIGCCWGMFFMRLKRLITGLIIALVYGTVLSCCAESVQLFTIDRVVSISDVLFNTIGSLVGYCCLLIGRNSVRNLGLLSNIKPLLRSEALIPLILCFFIFAQFLYPFDISLDGRIVKKKLLLMTTHPFRWPSFHDEPIIVLFLMVFVVSVLHMRFPLLQRYGAKVHAAMFITLVVGIKTLQFLATSRTPAGNDIIAAVVGIGLGFIVYKRNATFQLLIFELLIILSMAGIYFDPFKFTQEYQTVMWTSNIMIYISTVFELLIFFVFTGYTIFLVDKNDFVRQMLIFGCVLSIVLFEVLQGWVTGFQTNAHDIVIAIGALFAGIMLNAWVERRTTQAIKRIDES